MQNDDNNKPGKALQPQQQNNLPAALATSKKLVQHLKTALAKSSRELAEDDGWVERLIRGLEKGINENTIIKAVIKTANGKQELDYLPRDKALWLALIHLQFSGKFLGRLSILETLPTEIGKLHNLQELELGWNQLTTLPAAIGQLQNLQILWLSYNQLTSLPAEIGQLQNLQKLLLGNNQLTTLPAAIGQLQNLEWLDLRENPLRSLPESLKRLYRERNGALKIELDNPALLDD